MGESIGRFSGTSLARTNQASPMDCDIAEPHHPHAEPVSNVLHAVGAGCCSTPGWAGILAGMDEKPTIRRAFQFSILLMLLLVALFAEFFAAWRLTPTEPAYTPQNWLQIQKGMSEVEVEAIMGRRGRVFKSGGQHYWLFHDRSGQSAWSTLKVGFKNNHVVDAQCRE